MPRPIFSTEKFLTISLKLQGAGSAVREPNYKTPIMKIIPKSFIGRSNGSLPMGIAVLVLISVLNPSQVRAGTRNTVTGIGALYNNTTGDENTADGYQALYANTDGNFNTAIGDEALNSVRASQNTATGTRALYGSPNGYVYNSGSYNTATGFESLFSNEDGGGNVADGWQALYSNTSGQYNTASGVSALRQNTAGNNNTAMGTNALYHTNGSNNVALGYAAGQNLTTGSNNIIIGANVPGNSSDANTIRIGKSGTQQKTFIAGISGKTVASGIGVIINSNGQLGTVQSSARFKDDIKPMDQASDAILTLEPVTFHYKKDLDPDRIIQFGLIAEQVEKIDPDLVVRDEDGKVSTVRYDAVNAMLLNEFLKEHRTVQELKATAAKQQQTIAQQQKDFATGLSQQQKQIQSLTAGLQKVNSKIELERASQRLATSH